jgi:hypothetical protein
MGASTILLLMAAQQRRQHEEDERRRRRQREEEERRREEKRRREEEEYRKMIEHRKNSPVFYNSEDWQVNRCVKAISMQSCVQDLISLIDEVRPKLIEVEEKKFDSKILEAGYEYEVLRRSLDTDIETLKSLGISINGSQYNLSRLTPIDTLVAKPSQTTESFGSTFTIMGGPPIELNPSILSSEDYYERRYQESEPETIEKEFTELNLKMKKYHKFGKYLRFLLKTKKYLALEDRSEILTSRQEKCELRKKEMQSFKSLTKEQLLVIKSYFTHLDELKKISVKIGNLFIEKGGLRYPVNENVHDLAIKEVMSMEEYRELVSQTHEYVSRIYENEEETMKGAYELVKGEYPIEVDRRYIYDLIISNMRSYTREGIKELKLK